MRKLHSLSDTWLSQAILYHTCALVTFLVTVIKYLIKYEKNAFFGLLVSEGFQSIIAKDDMVKKFNGSGNIQGRFFSYLSGTVSRESKAE